jgi:hypothetical protein
MRKLTSAEAAAIQSIANSLPATDRDQLLSDMDEAPVRDVTPDGSRVQFFISGYSRPTYRGQHAIGSEGAVEDADGVRVGVLLHADENNRVLELELIKWGDAPIVGINWETFTIG